MHDENMFLTLTYDDDHLPEDGGLNHKHFQDFIRSVRKRLKRPVRYYMCGEYGDRTDRPHYHAILFGLRFDDCYHWTTRRGNRVWRSPFLEEVWYHGQSYIGSVTFQSAAYVARYIQKKIKGPEAKFHRPVVDADTGEIVGQLKPEYTQMSLKPGIGQSWIEKFKSDVFPEDLVTMEGGKKFAAPQYYRDWLKENDPELAEQLRQRRIELAKANADNSEERLAIREKCLKARVKNLKRELD